MVACLAWQQAGFLPGRGWIDQTVAFRQLLEMRHTCRSSVVIFLLLKGVFDSVDQTALFGALHRKSLSVKFANLL